MLVKLVLQLGLFATMLVGVVTLLNTLLTPLCVMFTLVVVMSLKIYVPFAFDTVSDSVPNVKFPVQKRLPPPLATNPPWLLTANNPSPLATNTPYEVLSALAIPHSSKEVRNLRTVERKKMMFRKINLKIYTDLAIIIYLKTSRRKHA